MKPSIAIFLLAILIFSVASVLIAQQSPLPQTGYPPNTVYDDHDFDVVNMKNLNVHIGLDLMKWKVRTGAGALSYRVDIDSAGLSAYQTCDYDDGCYASLLNTSTTFGGSLTAANGGQAFWGGSLQLSSNETIRDGIRYDTTTCVNGSFFTYIYNNVVGVDSMGTQHAFYPNQECGTSSDDTVIDFDRRYTADGSGLILFGTPGNSVNGQVMDSHGGLLAGFDRNGNSLAVPVSFPGAMDEPDFFNGYGIASCTQPPPSYSGTDDNGRTYTVTDGNCTSIPSNPSFTFWPSGSTYSRQNIQFTDSNGQSQSIVLNYQLKGIEPGLCQIALPTLESEAPEVSCFDQIVGSFLTSITLPNGQSYTFVYADQNSYPAAPYGQIIQITLPTGGTIMYDWQPATASIWNNPGISSNGPMSNNIPFCVQLTKRTVTDNNGNTSVWHYYGDGEYGCNGTVGNVVDPDGNETDYAFGGGYNILGITGVGETGGTASNLDPIPGIDLASSITSYSCNRYGIACANGTSTLTLLKTVTTGGNSLPGGGTDLSGFPTTTTTTWDNGGPTSSLITAHQIFQDPVVGVQFSWGSPTDTWEYDYGTGSSGNLIRHTTYTGYLNNSVSSSYFMNGSPSSSSFVGNLSGLYTNKTVYDGNGNTVAQATMTYDGQSLIGTPGGPAGVISHDETDFSPANSIRGNLTSQSDWASGSTWVTKQFQYDDTGRLVHSWDGNDNETTFGYTDSFLNGSPSAGISDTYITSVTKPTTNGVSHNESFQYYYDTGALASHTDDDSQITKYSYDMETAPITVSYPDTGQITYNYNNYAVPLTVTTTVASAPNPNKISKTIYDGVGRVIHQETATSLPTTGPSIVDTVYDPAGYTKSVSNPHYSSDIGYGSTSYTYDGLGRKLTQTQPDGSTLQWCYDAVPTQSGQSICAANSSGVIGTWVNSADENGNRALHVSDTFGRLLAAIEPAPAGGTLTTLYGYSALNDLISVNQKGNGTTDAPRTRSFSYDGLSRLVCASNPETSSAVCPTGIPSSYVTGTAGYTYDGNGNVVTKTSPAVNATSGTQTVGYCYDALNRMTYKFYTVSFSCSSPSGYAASYGYDTSSVSGASNATGRLTDEKSYAGNTLVSEQQPYGYDAMGRLLNENQITFANSKQITYPLTYQYDLAGNPIGVTDGVTPPQTPITLAGCSGGSLPPWLGGANPLLTFIHCYDAAGRLANTTSNWGDATHPPALFSNPSYAAFGGLTAAAFGTGSTGSTTINLNRGYDNRERLTSETDTGQANPPATTGSATVTITGVEQSH